MGCGCRGNGTRAGRGNFAFGEDLLDGFRGLKLVGAAAGRGAGLDPPGEQGKFVGVWLGFSLRRHVIVVAQGQFDAGQHRAVPRASRDEGGAGFPSLREGLERIDTQTALHLLGSVAGGAVSGENGLDEGLIDGECQGIPLSCEGRGGRFGGGGGTEQAAKWLRGMTGEETASMGEIAAEMAGRRHEGEHENHSGEVGALETTKMQPQQQGQTECGCRSRPAVPVEKGGVVAAVRGQKPAAECGGNSRQGGEPEQGTAADGEVSPAGKSGGGFQGDERHEHADGEVDEHRMEVTDELQKIGCARLHRGTLDRWVYCRCPAPNQDWRPGSREIPSELPGKIESLGQGGGGPGVVFGGSPLENAVEDLDSPCVQGY